MRELAIKIGISHTYLQLVEGGKTSTNERTIRRISDALNLSQDVQDEIYHAAGIMYPEVREIVEVIGIQNLRVLLRNKKEKKCTNTATDAE